MASKFGLSPVSDSFSNLLRNFASHYDQVPFYYEQSDEIDWSRPRSWWNINQDYTYFNLFGRVASENFTIEQLLANQEEFANGDLISQVDEETYNYKKRVDKICVVCEKDEHKEKIASLRCGHGHHVYCMENWMRNWNICPLCKFDELSKKTHSTSNGIPLSAASNGSSSCLLADSAAQPAEDCSVVCRGAIPYHTNNPGHSPDHMSSMWSTRLLYPVSDYSYRGDNSVINPLRKNWLLEEDHIAEEVDNWDGLIVDVQELTWYDKLLEI